MCVHVRMCVSICVSAVCIITCTSLVGVFCTLVYRGKGDICRLQYYFTTIHRSNL